MIQLTVDLEKSSSTERLQNYLDSGYVVIGSRFVQPHENWKWDVYVEAIRDGKIKGVEKPESCWVFLLYKKATS